MNFILKTKGKNKSRLEYMPLKSINQKTEVT